ncbi:MAG: SAM-dependent methyltransferase [Actinophytocola sp.]|nr:SAM-dependent methyltransferase [Actinophytocola sp.]
MAAAARAAHRLVDHPPLILDDPLAAHLLAERAAELIAYHQKHGGHLVLSSARAQVTVRARYTEDRLAEAVARGVEQYVLLGAGLDSFAYRSPLAEEVRVFEVDHPATQEYKRSVLSGIAPRGSVTHIPVDFEIDSLRSGLVDGGFDPARPALVGWHGVLMYLDLAAIEEVLAVVGRFAPGTELVADHMLPEGERDADGDAYVAGVAPVSAEGGEPWLTFLSTEEMAGLLARHGFEQVRAVGQRAAVPDALWRRTDSLRPRRLSMLVHAVVS